MQTIKTVKPTESPSEPDPVSRLISVLEAEGYTTDPDLDWEVIGERVYRRPSNVVFARGETVFVIIDYPLLNEKTLSQAVEGLTKLYRAKSLREKAFSVLQSTTVYVCIVARNESPHNEGLNRYVQSVGGAVIIPVVLVPEINQVVYPSFEEKVGVVRSRVQYLQYILGERTQAIDVHKQTVRTFYISAAILALLVLAMIFATIT